MFGDQRTSKGGGTGARELDVITEGGIKWEGKLRTVIR